MYTLFLDTHSQEVVVVLYKDKKVLQVVNKISGYQHSQVALPTIKAILEKEGIAPRDLGQIIVVVGPGSFTGVRIGVTIAKTMAYTLNIPIKMMDSLLIKAICGNEKNDFYVSVSEKNGSYVGKFSKEFNKIGDYFYCSKSEFEKFLENNKVVNIDKIDFEKVIKYVNKIEAVNPHSVKPLYIKGIEVLK